MVLSAEEERADFQRLVTDLYQYRDTYNGSVVPLEILTSDPVQTLFALRTGVPSTTTTDPCCQDVDSSGLQDQLTEIIRDVVNDSDSKSERITSKLDLVLQLGSRIEANGIADANPEEKANFYYLRGRALNILPAQNSARQSEAKLMLLKSLKYNPGFSDAWCELAELEWIEGEPSDAIGPLRSALSNNINHSESLWRLSMLLRQLPTEAKKNLKHTLLGVDEVLNCPSLTELLSFPPSTSGDGPSSDEDAVAATMVISLRLAHAAVKAAPGSGRAWECLGNALLSAFVQNGPRASTSSLITRSLAAFSQAAKSPVVAMEPHFHYNRGVAWHFQGNFSESLTSWFRSAVLDPAWPAPQTRAIRLVNFLRRVADEINAFSQASSTSDASNQTVATTTNSIRRHRKRLKELLAPLAPCLQLRAESTENGLQSSQQLQHSLTKLLGPYYTSGVETATNSSTSVKQRATSLTALLPKLQFSFFVQLEIGSNVGKVCCGRIVTAFPSDDNIAINYLLTDAEASLLVLRIYQIAKGCGPSVKDIIAVPDPFIEECVVSKGLLQLVTTFNACIKAEGGGADEDDEEEFGEQSVTSPVHHDADINLRLLRVPTPDILCVNGRRVGRAWTAPLLLQNVFFTSS